MFVFVRSVRKSLSPVLDSGGSGVMKRRTPEEMDKDLRGADASAELSLHLKEGRGGAEGQFLLTSANNYNLLLFPLYIYINYTWKNGSKVAPNIQQLDFDRM